MRGPAPSSPSSIQRRFRLRRRQEPNAGDVELLSWNLFARLDHAIASALFRDAQLVAASEATTTNLTPSSQAGWTAVDHPSSSSDDVEFLPLELTFASGERAYVSYNGGDLSSTEFSNPKDDRIATATFARTERGIPNEDAHPVIELPSSVVPDSFHQQTDTVLVRPLSHVRDAETIHFEPLSVSDWDLLENDAQVLEDGGLLQQISVVYPNQIIPLRIKGRDVAHVKVVQPPPQSDNDADDDDPRSHNACCWRLLAATEVLVSPPISTSSEGVRNRRGEALVMRVYPTCLDYSEAMQSLAKDQAVTLVRPEGTSFGYVHPVTLRQLQGLSNDDGPMEVKSEANTNESVPGSIMAVVELAESGGATLFQVIKLEPVVDGIPANHIGLHPMVGLALQACPLVTKVKVRILTETEVELGPVSLLESLANALLKMDMKPVRISPLDMLKPWRLPINSSGQQVFHSLWSNCDLLWEPSRCTFELFPGAPDDAPVTSGSLLRICTSSDSRCPKIFCIMLETQDSSSTIETSSVGAFFMLIKDLVALLNQAVDIVEQAQSGFFDRFSTNEQHSSHSDTLNVLPPTWRYIPLHEVDSNSAKPRHTAIAGPLGSGRTHAALMMAAMARIHDGCSTHYLDCKNLKLSPDVRMKDLLDEFITVFRKARQAAPSLIILDNLDEVAPNLLNESNNLDTAGSQNYRQVNPASVDQAKLVADQLCRLATEACTSSFVATADVTVVITCCDLQQIVPSILTMLSWKSIFTPLNLSPEVRRDIFSAMLNNECSRHHPTPALSPTIDRLLEGFRSCDLETIARRVGKILLKENESIDCNSFDSYVKEALRDYVPVARQSVVVDDSASSLCWSDIGGLFRVKAKLAESILHPVKYKRIYAKSPVKLPRGILLFGPPGCGKSILVPALARECGFRLVTCRGPELLDKYIGASEAKVRELFARAKAASPCVLFLDEFDALAPRRGSDNTGVTDRVVNQLLTFLDGVEDALNDMMYIIAATSRPDKIDPALLRPGRLEKHFYVGFPENEIESTDIVARIATNWNLDDIAAQAIASGDHQLLVGTDDFNMAKHVMQKFSGADLKAVFDTAHIGAVHDHLKHGGSENTITVELKHLQSAFQKTRPSLSSADCKMLMDIYLPFLRDGSNEMKHETVSRPEERRLLTALR